jgi:hypothetical protein
MELSLHIILEKPTPGVAFGLQKGSGNKYETIQIQRCDSGDLNFYLTVTVKGDRLKDTLPRFGSSFIQGPYMGNFIYLDIGTLTGQLSPWNRRLKIPMAGITWQVIDQLQANQQQGLETFVAGTAKDGSPNCATVKPFNGWQVASL